MITPPDWIPTTVAALNENFAGRVGSEGYDVSKLYHIHRRNRAFVWKQEDQERLLDSILKGYVIPPIYCSSSIRISHSGSAQEVRNIMEGGNRITTLRRILAGQVKTLSPTERATVERHQIVMVVLRNLTPSQEREMFRRLNKSVKVTDGQLFAMSEEDSPLVREAVAFLEDDAYPLRATITELFCETRGCDNDGKTALANAMALISGALNGPAYITKSFNVQEQRVEDQTALSRATIVERLNAMFEVFRMANRAEPMEDKRKKPAQLVVGRLPGVILYDLHMNPDEAAMVAVQKKWADFTVRLRRFDTGALEIMARRIWGANLNPDRYKRISTLVDVYLQERRILTDEELKLVRHPRPEEFTDEESSEASGAED